MLILGVVIVIVFIRVVTVLLVVRVYMSGGIVTRNFRNERLDDRLVDLLRNCLRTAKLDYLELFRPFEIPFWLSISASEVVDAVDRRLHRRKPAGLLQGKRDILCHGNRVLRFDQMIM